MSTNEEAIRNIKIEKTLSIIFILIGLANIHGDDLLIKATKTGDTRLDERASTIFLWGLIISFFIYIVIVARNYNFYIDKKNSGADATLELTRLYGSILVLLGFILVFYFFIQDNNLDSDDPPVIG